MRSQYHPAMKAAADPICYLNTKLVSDIDYERIKGLTRKKMSMLECSEYFRYVLDADIETKLKEVWE